MKKNKRNFNLVGMLASMVLSIVLERIFSPYLERMLGWVSSKGLRVTDFLYLRIAENFMVNIPFYIFLLLSVFLTMYILRVTHKKKDEDDCKKTCKKKQCKHCPTKLRNEIIYFIKMIIKRIPVSVVLVFAWSIIIVFLTMVNYINHCIVRINNNIDIVSEYIDDVQSKHLKSSFLQMKNYDDYKELISEIQNIADMSGIELQE